MNSMMPAYYGIPFGTGFPSGVFRPDLMAKGLLNRAAACSGSTTSSTSSTKTRMSVRH